MNYAEICIIKRDGKREDFSISKIKNAIGKAFSATGIQDEQQLIADVTHITRFFQSEYSCTGEAFYQSEFSAYDR